MSSQRKINKGYEVDIRVIIKGQGKQWEKTKKNLI